MRIRFCRTTSSRTRFSHRMRVAFQGRDLVELVDLHPLVLVGDQALDERDRYQPLAGAYRHDFVQQGRRIDDRFSRQHP